MRCLGLVVVCCFALIWTAQSKLRKKEGLEERVKRLCALTSVEGGEAMVQLTGDRFQRYVLAAPRNYSVILMLTASQHERKCPTCNEAHAELEIVARSWQVFKERSNQMFFAVADVDEAPEVFRHLQLNMAPVFVHYPATSRPQMQDIMEINRFGFAAEQIARFIAERTQILIPIVRPPNYKSLMAMAALAIVAAALLYVKRDSLVHIFSDPTRWAVSVLMIIFAMTSGQMWNYIQQPPFMHRDPRTGLKHYIYEDFQGQFVFETYIVIFIQAAIFVGFIMLNEAGSLKRDANIKRIVAILGLLFIAVFFALLLYVFKIKHMGYPYSLADVLQRGFWMSMISS